jgi:hypothetical protein
MDYSATEANPIASSGYPDNGDFGAGQGCSGNCWTQTSMFPSDNVLDLGLTLYDNQAGWGGPGCQVRPQALPIFGPLITRTSTSTAPTRLTSKGN